MFRDGRLTVFTVIRPSLFLGGVGCCASPVLVYARYAALVVATMLSYASAKSSVFMCV